jgi:tyrosine-protein kinase Etk/Wzc
MGNYPKQFNGSSDKDQKDGAEKISIDPAKLFKILMSRSYWLMLSFVICLGIAYVYAKSAKQVFVSEAILKYDSKSKEAKFSTNALLAGTTSENSDYMAEVYRIKSTNVLGPALDSLHAKFIFYRKSGLRSVNLYPQRPFDADILDYRIDDYPGGTFQLTKKGNGYDLRFFNDQENIDTLYKNVKEGSLIKIPGLSFRLRNNVFTEFDKVTFTYIDYWTIKAIAGRIVIKEVERNLPVLLATFTSDNGAFSKDFLNTVISSYSQFDLQGKMRSSEVTLDFINEQLGAFEGLMRKSSSKLENIKQQYDVLDVNASSNQYMSAVNDLRSKKLNLEIQGQNFDLVTDNIKNNKEVVANVIGWDGAPDPFLNSMLQALNTAFAQRKQNLINYSEQSIVIRNLDGDIEQLKRKIIENVNLQRQKAQQAYAAYDKQLAMITKDLNRMPAAERDLIYTTSDVEVNKNIYTMLLNKKLETNIDKAGQTPTFTSIENPQVAVKTAPNEIFIILIGGAIGLFIGILLVFLARLFNTRFTDVNAIMKFRNVSLMGIVKNNSTLRSLSEPEVLRQQLSDDVFSEDLNAIRTNILYQFDNKPNKLIVVTSGSPGEGKSFFSVSLAAALSKLNRSVIVIESDLRRPKLHRYFEQANKTGLSNYLEQDIELNSIINNSGVGKLDFITSGQASKKPSELLHTDKFLQMLETLKARYDYVIVDTAPVGMVSDSIPVLRISDLGVFLLRWRYSAKEAVNIPYALVENYGLNKLGVVVNDYKDDVLYASLGGINDGDSMYSSAYYNFREDIGKKRRWRIFNRQA